MTIKNECISEVLVSATTEADENMSQDDEDSRTELGSHANMAVVGRNCYILAKHKDMWM